jgi:hypothetical protein
VHFVELALVRQDEVPLVIDGIAGSGEGDILTGTTQPFRLQHFEVGVREQVYADAIGCMLERADEHLDEYWVRLVVACFCCDF